MYSSCKLVFECYVEIRVFDSYFICFFFGSRFVRPVRVTLSFMLDTDSKSNQIFEAVIVELKRQRFCKVDHHIPISKEFLETIQSSYNQMQSSPGPKSLQQVVWFNIMFHLIRRGRENLRPSTKESFPVQVDTAGKVFLSSY